MTQKQKKYTTSTFVILLFAALLVVGVFYVGDVSSQSQNANGSIDLTTKTDNKTKKLSDPVWKLKVPNKQLVNESQFIVVGKPVSNLCVPSGDGSEVVTEYKFKIEEVIKGTVSATDVISVRFPGGLIRQPDGSTFNVVSSGFKKMRNNYTYLLFLKENEYRQLISTRGPQGVFEFVDNSAALISYGTFAKENFKPNTNEENLNTIEFLEEIRRLVKDKNK